MRDRIKPTVERVLNDDFKTNIPAIDSIRDILNLGDNLLKIFNVETLTIQQLQMTYPFIQPVAKHNINTTEIISTDSSGIIERYFLFNQPNTHVRLVSQLDGFETRLILLLNEHLSQYQNSQYVFDEITPEVIDVINTLVKERLCRQI